MPFIQIVEFRTSNFDKIQGLDNEWRQATEGTRTLRRSIVCRDTNDKTRHLVLAFFDSAESAKVNSELAATTNFANQVNAMVDAPITFQDLEVVEDQT